MRALGGALAVAALVVVVLVVREQTMSRHVEDTGPGVLEVVFTLEENQTTATRLEAAEALVNVCALEVRGSLVSGSLASLAEGRLRARLSPPLDATDRAQFHGCMEDLWVDHVRADVVSMQRVAPG